MSEKKRFKVKNGIRRKITPEVILTALRVVYFLGIRDNNRHYFWGILFWLVRKKKFRYADTAVYFMALMYHYKMMWKNFLTGAGMAAAPMMKK